MNLARTHKTLPPKLLWCTGQKPFQMSFGNYIITIFFCSKMNLDSAVRFFLLSITAKKNFVQITKQIWMKYQRARKLPFKAQFHFSLMRPIRKTGRRFYCQSSKNKQAYITLLISPSLSFQEHGGDLGEYQPHFIKEVVRWGGWYLASSF